MRIVFVGPPGSGKGTQAAQLAEHLAIPHLSTGEVLRQAIAGGTPVGNEAAEFVNSGRLVPDDVVVGVVIQRLQEPDCKVGCLFDGFPRTLAQAEKLDEILKQQGTPLDCVLALHVPEEKLIERLLGRGRGDDNLGTIRERFEAYEAQTKPLLQYYEGCDLLRTIDGAGTPEEVFHRIQAVVGSASE